MGEREVPITVAQRIVIKFLTNENVGPNEIWRRLRAQYEESTLSKTQVKFCHKEFRGGMEAAQNTSHLRHPRPSISPENITAVRDLIEGNRWLTVVEICQELWERAVHHQKRAAASKNFGPMGTQAVERSTKKLLVFKSLKHCSHCEEEGDAFIHRIVTCDETWVHHYTPETKRASKELRGMGEECPVKAKTRLSAGKLMAKVFWDFKGVLLIDFLHARRTVNAAYYCNLLEKVRAAYR